MSAPAAPAPSTPPRLAVGGIIFVPGANGPSVVLVRRAARPLPGRWSLPGGRVEPGERLERAVAREMREETGLDVRVGPLVEVVELIEPGHHWVILDYACEPIGGTLTAGDDAADVALVPVGELGAYAVSDAVLRVVQRALAMT